LGKALLTASFHELYKQEFTTIGLTVDTANNSTGATQLYEHSGMQIASQYVLYKKEYRAGLEQDK
jgi:hypothetical protein